MKYFIHIFILNFWTSGGWSWPVQVSRRGHYFNSSCHNCFNFISMEHGRRIIVEPCGGHNCLPIVYHKDFEKQNAATQTYDLNNCGKTKYDRHPNSGFIKLKVSTNVENTLRPAEYPWLVRIESRSDIFSRTVTLCAGTLIHPQWIVTAAHCMFDSRTNRLYPANGIQLYIGNYNRIVTNRNEYVVQPLLYIVHPQFRISRLTPAPIHDLALIKLAKPVPMSSLINIACLPQSTDKLKDGILAFTAGWGHTSPSSNAANEPRKARLRISPNSCQQLMINPYYHICGRNPHGHNICSGDSGAGLLVKAGIKSGNSSQTNWKWHLFGVASYGLDECSEKQNQDNAFASLTADIKWINRMITSF